MEMRGVACQGTPPTYKVEDLHVRGNFAGTRISQMIYTAHGVIAHRVTAHIQVIPCQINTKRNMTLTDFDETWFLHSLY